MQEEHWCILNIKYKTYNVISKILALAKLDNNIKATIDCCM